MAKSTPVQLSIFDLMTSGDSFSVTSSLASPDGDTLCVSRDGQTTAKSGQAPVRVNRSPSPAPRKAKATSVISGLYSSALSKPAVPLSSWESRLRLRLARIGSTECSLTWKESVTPAGRPLSRLVPSTRPIAAIDCGLWQTPVADDAIDRAKGKVNSRGEPKLSGQVIAMWRTTQAVGAAPSGSPEPTEKPGALAPEFVAWLMGFPAAWLDCAPVMPKRSKNAGRKEAQKVVPKMLACERCGSEENLSRHHKDRDTDNNLASNLEVLCRPCHVAEHQTDGTWGTGPTPIVECAICGEFFKPKDHPGRAMICSEICHQELGRRAAMKRWHGESLSLYSRTAFLTGSVSCAPLAMPSSRKSQPK